MGEGGIKNGQKNSDAIMDGPYVLDSYDQRPQGVRQALYTL